MKKLKFLGVLLVSLLTPLLVNAVSVDNIVDLRMNLENGKSVELTKDLTINDVSTKVDGRSPGVAIVGSGEIILDGQGHKIDSSSIGTIFEIFAEDGKSLNVTLKNITIESNKDYVKGINTRTGNLNIILDNVKLDFALGQPFTIGGKYDASNINTVNIKNSVVNAGVGYAITTFNPVDMFIYDSEVSGWNALNIKGAYTAYTKTDAETKEEIITKLDDNHAMGSAGSTITVVNSKLSGTNVNDDSEQYPGTNDFGTIKLEDIDVTINIDKSYISAEALSTANQYLAVQGVLGKYNNQGEIEKYNGNNYINITNSELYTKVDNYAFSGISNVSLSSGVSSNVEINNVKFNNPNYNLFWKFDKDNNQYILLPKYDVLIPLEIENGTLLLNKDYVFAGEEITLTIKPDEGYELDSIKVIDFYNNNIKVENNKFVMPESEVWVRVDFKPIQKTVIPEVTNENPVGVKSDEKVNEILLKSLAKLDEYKDLAVNVEVVVEDIKVEKDIEKEFTTALNDNKVSNGKIVSYFDISIAIKDAISKKKLGNITELTDKIQFKVQVPDMENVKEGYVRSYYIIKKHGDKVEVINGTLSDDKKYIIFETNEFSTYALAYEDKATKVVENVSVPQTFDGVSMNILVGTLSLVGFVSLGLYLRKEIKKVNN